ncbi:MAG TPA: serine hydrolase [Actinopolymorphaceae bacterium]|nr:serine hydrolase [Actinopolymorphaceae bacterium]
MNDATGTTSATGTSDATDQPRHLRALEPVLSEVAGAVSVWCGRPGSAPAYSRRPDDTHYAASTMKTAVMAAAYRLAEQDALDLDAEIRVHDTFGSALGDGSTYCSTSDYDNDPEPWARHGGVAPLRWLVRRMIVRSSNLATNLVLERVGLGAVSAAWAAVGAKYAVVARGIQDYAADQAGRSNLVTAADLAALLSAIHLGAHGARPERVTALAAPESCREMLDVLRAQEVTEDVVRGLPAGTTVAHKNGWVDGIRHSSALVFPPDCEPYVLVTCISAPLDHAAGCDLVAQVAAASWADRQVLDGHP